MKKAILTGFMIVLFLASLVYAVEFTPQGNINMKDRYNITNISWIEGAFSIAGNITLSDGYWIDADTESENVKNPPANPGTGYAISYFVDNLSTMVASFFNIDGDEWMGDFNGMLYNLFNISNMTVEGYYDGQPIDGGLGSGIISAEDINVRGGLNITDEGGLDVSFGAFTVRLQYNNNNSVKYCEMAADTVTVTDNQHSAYYVDWNCVLQSTTIATRAATDLYPGGTACAFDIFATDGDIEEKHGKTVMSVENCKTRRKILETDHLQVISGMGRTEGTFPVIETAAGSYLYFRTVKTTSTVNTTENGIHIVYHSGGDWTHDNQTELNLTHCDDGTDTATCPSNLFRQYLVYLMGSEDGTDSTKLHQLAPLTTEPTYNNIGACVDAVPTYTLPDKEAYVAIPLYVYCARRDDSSWGDGWIALDTGGVVGGQPDLSAYVRRDGTTQPTGNWDFGGYEISNMEMGSGISWTDSQNLYKYNATNGTFYTGDDGDIRLTKDYAATVTQDGSSEYNCSDETCIISAMDYVEANGGGIVMVRAGTYNTSNIINWTYTTVKLKGEGKNSTILSAWDSNVIEVYVADVTVDLEDIQIKSTSYDANEGIGIYTVGDMTHSIEINNVKFNNTLNSIVYANPTTGGDTLGDIKIRNSIFTGSLNTIGGDYNEGYHVVYITGNKDRDRTLLIENNVFEGGSRDDSIGLALWGDSTNEVGKNDTTNIKFGTVKDNKFYSPTREGMFIGDAQYLVINGNKIYDSGRIGLCVIRNYRSSVTLNIVNGSAQRGLRFDQNYECTLSFNEVYHVGVSDSNAIAVGGMTVIGDDNIIIGNTILAEKDAAILIDSGSTNNYIAYNKILGDYDTIDDDSEQNTIIQPEENVVVYYPTITLKGVTTLDEITEEHYLLAYNFNNESVDGTAILDSSRFVNDGVAYNSPTFSDSDGFNHGGYITFNSSESEYINSWVDIPIEQYSAHSFSFWFKTSDLNQNNYLFSQEWSKLGCLIKGASYEIECYSRNSADEQLRTDNYLSSSYENQWNYLVTTVQSSNMRTYVNGISIDTGTGASSFKNLGYRMFIGCQGAGSSPAEYYNGSMDDFRFYNRALSSREVLDNYEREFESRNPDFSRKNAGKVYSDINMTNNIIEDIGASGTDFTATGGLTLADTLTIPALTATANLDIGAYNSTSAGWKLGDDEYSWYGASDDVFVGWDSADSTYLIDTPKMNITSNVTIGDSTFQSGIIMYRDDLTLGCMKCYADGVCNNTAGLC